MLKYLRSINYCEGNSTQFKSLMNFTLDEFKDLYLGLGSIIVARLRAH